MSAVYPDLDAYNADAIAARAAYRADEFARDGICVECERRKRDGRHRRCTTCRRTVSGDTDGANDAHQ